MTGKIDKKLEDLGLQLPAEMKLPPDVVLPFSMCKVVGRRVLVSGHLPLAEDGSFWPVTGKVGAQVSPEQAYTAARQTTLAMLGSLQRTLGSLDRIDQWVRVFGMVNTAPGYHLTAPVINGCSELLLEVFGSEVGSHARSAVGLAELPFNMPVEIEAELEIQG